MNPTTLRSICVRSEFVFHHFDGAIETRNDHLVLRTHSNPNFFWGNYLLFSKPPQRGDFARWQNSFLQEFPDPQIYHQAFAWDEPLELNGSLPANAESQCLGDISEFLAQGFELEKTAVLVCDRMQPPARATPEEFRVRILQTDADWEAMITLQVAAAHDNLPKTEWVKFYRKQSERFRALTAAGRGAWFGGFLGDQLVTGLGIFHEAGLGRYQIVATHPEFQRRGFAGQLVYAAGEMALSEWGLAQLVICADPDYHAIKLYESVGFARRQIQYGVYWWDRQRQS